MDDERLLDIDSLINQEKLLFLALHVLNSNSNQELINIAQDIVIWYKIRQFQAEGVGINDINAEKVTKEVNKEIFGSMFDSLVQKGMIEEEIPGKEGDEPTYRITEFGRMVSEKMKRQDHD